MKILKSLQFLLVSGLLFTACSPLDIPEPVNEEEVITTMTVTLKPDVAGDAITLKKYDLDGDGPDAPVISVSGNLAAGTTYKGSIVLLNQTVNPAGEPHGGSFGGKYQASIFLYRGCRA